MIVALTTDEEVRLRKGYDPELGYDARKEILESIRYVAEVVPCRWLLDDVFLDQHRIDLLVHGTDDSNLIRPDRLLILPENQWDQQFPPTRPRTRRGQRRHEARQGGGAGLIP